MKTCLRSWCDKTPHLYGRGFCQTHYTKAISRREITPYTKEEKQANTDAKRAASRVPCSVSWCDRVARCKGLCKSHYGRLRSGVPLEKPWHTEKARCTADECNSYVKGKGFCDKHLRRFNKHGDPNIVSVVRRKRASKVYTYQEVTYECMYCDDEYTIIDKPAGQSLIRCPSCETLKKQEGHVLRTFGPSGLILLDKIRNEHLCEMCGLFKARLMSIDHSHKAGHLRGILCRNCNAALGLFNDDLSLLAKALKYLEDGTCSIKITEFSRQFIQSSRVWIPAIPSKSADSITCKECLVTKPLSDFYYLTKKNVYEKVCQECRKYKRRLNHVYRKYGILGLEAQNLIDVGTCCDICSTEVSTTINNVAIDHDHETNEVRGILCRSCNSGIGNLKDSTDLLKSAMKYLQETEYAV